jgi:TonB family protein
MRRVRRQTRQFQAIDRRLTLAILFSVALHVALLSGLTPQAGNPAITHPVPLQARLMLSRTTPDPPRTLAKVDLDSRAAATPDPLPVAANPEHTGDADPETQSPVPDAALQVAGLPQAPDPVHYAVKDLDVFPQLQAALHPGYPETALQQKIPGSVTLLVLVDEAGRVTSVSVVDAVPQDMFDDSARQALYSAAFMPAQREGRTVRSRILVNVSYDPENP